MPMSHLSYFNHVLICTCHGWEFCIEKKKQCLPSAHKNTLYWKVCLWQKQHSMNVSCLYVFSGSHCCSSGAHLPGWWWVSRQKKPKITLASPLMHCFTVNVTGDQQRHFSFCWSVCHCSIIDVHTSFSFFWLLFEVVYAWRRLSLRLELGFWSELRGSLGWVKVRCWGMHYVSESSSQIEAQLSVCVCVYLLAHVCVCVRICVLFPMCRWKGK